MDTRKRTTTAPLRLPETTPPAGGVAVPHPAADGKRLRPCARVIALRRRLARAVAADGLVPGVARCLLAGLYFAVLINVFRRGGDACACAITALLFIAIYAWVLDDWREAPLVLFAPDASLWRPPPGWNWLERLGVAACRHAVLWFVLPFLCAGLPCRPEWILPLPLLASVTQRALEGVRQRLHRRRLARLPRGPGCGAPSVTNRGTPSVPGTQLHNNAGADRVHAGGPHGGGSARTSL
jgi:hypothetical protein